MLARSLSLASATLTGLLAGAMLFLRVILLPFWQRLPPAEFRAWFEKHAPRIRALMVPLGVGSAAASVGAAAAQAASKGSARPSSAAAAGAVAVVAVTVTVNEPANEKFVSGDLDDEATVTLLARWARWHDVRVALGLLSAVAAVYALQSAPRADG